MQTINAGESFSGECPNGQTPNIHVGEKLPNIEKASVKVLKVEGSTFVLGPTKAGEIIVNVPCGESIQEITFTVNEMPPEAAMNRYKPMGTEKVEYPLTLFILIVALILAPLLGFFAYKFRKKKVHEELAKNTKKKESPRELLEKELSFLQSNVTHPESHHFHQLYKRLRKFIEKELSLKTRSLTTQEFLGTFRALALQQSANQSLVSQLEYVLRTADDVRFAGKAFTPELWKDYLQKTNSVVAAFPKRVEVTPTKERKQK